MFSFLMTLFLVCGCPAFAQNGNSNAGNQTSAKKKDAEIVFWETIKDSSDAEDFKAYLEKYPDGEFAALAKNRLKSLGKSSPKESTGERPVSETKEKPSDASSTSETVVASYKLEKLTNSSTGVLNVYQDRIEYVDADQPKHNVLVSCSEITKVGTDLDVWRNNVEFIFIKTGTEKHKFTIRNEFFAAVKYKYSLDDVAKSIRQSCGLAKK